MKLRGGSRATDRHGTNGTVFQHEGSDALLHPGATVVADIRR
jgi:hypothetical protein